MTVAKTYRLLKAINLDTYLGDDEAFVFLGVKGAMLRRSTFTRPWAKALKQAGLSGSTSIICVTRETPSPRSPTPHSGS